MQRYAEERGLVRDDLDYDKVRNALRDTTIHSAGGRLIIYDQILFKEDDLFDPIFVDWLQENTEIKDPKDVVVTLDQVSATPFPSDFTYTDFALSQTDDWLVSIERKQITPYGNPRMTMPRVGGPIPGWCRVANDPAAGPILRMDASNDD